MEQKEAEHLKQLQGQENAEQLRRIQKEQEEQKERKSRKSRKSRIDIELQQQAFLKELAQKASDINDDIIRLSRRQDYGAMKAKFTELENTIIALKTLKDEMAKQKDRQERERQRQKKLTEELERQKRLYEEEQARPQTELKHREEFLRQQVQVRQRQDQLEARREAIRKQLEDGVEAMYQEALRVYQKGDYAAAADKFKDVRDIIPGYKRSEQYMDEARQKSLTVNLQVVSKVLDLFDSK